MSVSDRQHQIATRSYIWSLPHLRSNILSHLTPKDLVKVSTLSQENFTTAIGVLYAKCDYVDYQGVVRVCQSRSRLRQYNLALRYIKMPWYPEANYAELFGLHSQLQSVKFSGNRIQLAPSTSFEQRQFVNYIKVRLGPGDVDDYQYIEDVLMEYPKEWDINFVIRKLMIDQSEEEEEEVILEERSRFFKAWSNNIGIFQVSIEKMYLDSPTSIEDLFEVIDVIKQKGHAMPREIRLMPLDYDEKRTLVNLISKMSSMVEELDIRNSHGRTPFGKSDMYDFINSKFVWPSKTDMKLRRLYLTFNVNADDALAYTSDVNSTEQNPPSTCLTHFSITLNLAPLQRLGKVAHFAQYIPSLGQIARAMYMIGGRFCQYNLDVNRTSYDETDDIRTEMLNGILNREIWELGRDRNQVPGWRKLLPEEKGLIAPIRK